MDIQMLTSVSVIVADPAAGRRLFADTLGLPLTKFDADEYYASETISGSKHFGVWPLAQAAEACFGTRTWPSDVPIPQASIEFEVSDAAAVGAAGEELQAAGHRLLHVARTEPWGQTVVRLQTDDGLIVGISYAPSLHSDH